MGRPRDKTSKTNCESMYFVVLFRSFLESICPLCNIVFFSFCPFHDFFLYGFVDHKQLIVFIELNFCYFMYIYFYICVDTNVDTNI